ncbi:hypothetical protein HNQ02_002934 [Flavobacterium sp. 7E]|uniref:hypothetical protein n=1 Tax=Flavobacterium sp. 7E TaxID=2735898 RepID=UPI00156D5A85|nr:hypothetical protein [Flavobacterium sp. 7E]NRS89999.1 hypothetical protein [Flavobacterium sp. 7E]
MNSRKKMFIGKILFLFLIISFFGCKKPKNEIISYDKLEYYHSNFYELPGPPDNSVRFKVYYSDFVEIKDRADYLDLTSIGFEKKEIKGEFSLKIKDFFTDIKPPSRLPDYSCLNCYQDIILFYNNAELIGIAKFDFICDKYYYSSFKSGKIIYLDDDCLKYKNFFNDNVSKPALRRVL